jgi:hypothetical protein
MELSAWTPHLAFSIFSNPFPTRDALKESDIRSRPFFPSLFWR